VSCPTEALFFAAVSPEPLLPGNLARPSRVKVPLRPQLTGTVSAAFSAKASTKFSEIS
jgi:hypothetical protein